MEEYPNDVRHVKVPSLLESIARVLSVARISIWRAPGNFARFRVSLLKMNGIGLYGTVRISRFKS
jgi:hypothetical protein